MKKQKMRKPAKLLIGLDMLAILMNLFVLILDFNILRLELILAFGVIIMLVYKLEHACLYILELLEDKKCMK